MCTHVRTINNIESNNGCITKVLIFGMRVSPGIRVMPCSLPPGLPDSSDWMKGVVEDRKRMEEINLFLTHVNLTISQYTLKFKV